VNSITRALRSALGGLAAAWLSTGCAELVVRNVRTEPLPSTVLQGEVANQGSTGAEATRTSVSTRTSYEQPFVERARVPTPALPKGQQVELALWSIPAPEMPRPGACLHVRVCADAGGTVRELNEANNCTETSIGNDAFCPSVGLCCGRDLPYLFDWTSWNGTNWVTGVRDQEQCGSCWAHAALAAVEAAANLQRRGPGPAPDLDLSEQQLVTCSPAGDCLGGWPHAALSYVQTDRVVHETTFPYQSQDCTTSPGGVCTCTAGCSCPGGGPCARPCTCSWPGTPQRWRIGGYRIVDVTGVTDKVAAVKRALVCRGPLAVCADWDGQGHGHCVLLVGWVDATPLTPESWIIKNSWGLGWHSLGLPGGYGRVPVSGVPFSELVNYAYYVEDVR